MPYPDEYDTWMCDDPEAVHPGRFCWARWVLCTDCENGIQNDGTACDACSGSGGGHTCAYDPHS